VNIGKKLLVIFISAVITVLLFVAVPASGDENNNLLYIGDEPWYNEASYPMVKIRQLYYIPVSAIERIEGITVRSNDALKNIMISYKDGKYISFDTSSAQFAYTEERGQFFLQTYLLYDNERYIPAEEVAGYFGFSFELYGDGKAARLSDGSSDKTFEELLAKYNPEILYGDGPDVTTYNPIDRPPSPAAVDDVYLLFLWENGDIAEVLDAVKGKGIYITVFAAPEKFTESPELLIRIVSEGHEFGFVAKNIADFEKLNSANNFICSITKRKTHLVYGVDLSEYGYVHCTDIKDAFSSSVKISPVVAQTAIEELKQNKSPKIVFDSSDITVGALPEIIDYITKNSKCIARGLTAAVAYN